MDRPIRMMAGVPRPSLVWLDLLSSHSRGFDVLDRQAQDLAAFDHELISRTANGDRRAFEQIVSRHATAVFRLAKVLTGDAVAAEVVGIGEQAFHTRLHRARLRLAGALRGAALLDTVAQEGGA